MKNKLYPFLLLLFISCSKNTTDLFSYENIHMYSFVNQDSIMQIVFHDDYAKTRDTFSIGYKGTVPSVLMKDLNKDGKNDVVVVFDYSDPVSLCRYQVYFSDRSKKLAPPKIFYRGDSINFFNYHVDDLINYNLKIVNDTLFMFQHGYSVFQFFTLKENSLEPTVSLKREEEEFSLAVWNRKKSQWSEKANFPQYDKISLKYINIINQTKNLPFLCSCGN